MKGRGESLRRQRQARKKIFFQLIESDAQDEIVREASSFEYETVNEAMQKSTARNDTELLDASRNNVLELDGHIE